MASKKTVPASSDTFDRVLSTRSTMALTTLSRTSLWRLSRQGSFPSPIQLSQSRIGWRESDVNAWLASRARRGPQEAA